MTCDVFVLSLVGLLHYNTVLKVFVWPELLSKERFMLRLSRFIFTFFSRCPFNADYVMVTTNQHCKKKTEKFRVIYR